MSIEQSLDIKCVSFGRVGTMALNKALSKHSRVLMPSWNVAHGHLRNEQPLMALFPQDSDQHSCLMIHHQELFLEKYGHLLDRVASQPARHLIHLVRDPARHMIGWYNHIVECALLGMHKWTLPGSLDEAIVRENIILPTLEHERTARMFYPQAEEIMLVDFHQFQRQHFSDTLGKIQVFSGLDREPAPFTEVQNDLTTKILHRGMTFTLNGESVSFSMVQQSSASEKFLADHFTSLDGVGEMMKAQAPSLRPVDGKLYIGFAADTQIKKSTYDIIKTHQQQIFGPAIEGWVKNAENFATQIAERRVTELSPQQQSRLWRLIGDDVQAFVRRYPQLKDLWSMT